MCDFLCGSKSGKTVVKIRVKNVLIFCVTFLCVAVKKERGKTQWDMCVRMMCVTPKRL